MNKNLKKIVATFCMGTMTFSVMPAVAMAERTIPFSFSQDELIAPYMQYIDLAYCQLTIDEEMATVEGYVAGDYYNATKAKVIAELQVKNGSDWIPVAIWTVTEDGDTARVDETHSIVSGHTYRAKATVTVWEGSASETQVVYSDEMTC